MCRNITAIMRVFSTGACTSQLRDRSSADGSAILAGRGGDDANRGHDRITRDEHGSFSVVPRGTPPDRLLDLRYDALPVATPDLVIGFGNAVRDVWPVGYWPLSGEQLIR